MEDSERCQLALTHYDHISLILPKKDFNRIRLIHHFLRPYYVSRQTNEKLNHWESFRNVGATNDVFTIPFHCTKTAAFFTLMDM